MVRTGKLGLLLTALSVYKMNLTHFEYVSKDKFYVIIIYFHIVSKYLYESNIDVGERECFFRSREWLSLFLKSGSGDGKLKSHSQNLGTGLKNSHFLERKFGVGMQRKLSYFNANNRIFNGNSYSS